MKRIILSLILLGALMGCTSRTEYGDCVGLREDKDPKLTYKVSAWNVAMAVIFFEAIAPPIFVAVDQTFCPVGKK